MLTGAILENTDDEICIAERGRGSDAAKAQEVIYNPGYCAQFYPYANCQNKGPNNPYTGDDQRRVEMRNAVVLGASPCAMGAQFYIGRGGQRIFC
jgi:hypothetical protein